MNSPKPLPVVELLRADEFAEHAKLSPSGSRGWLACAGRIALESLAPSRPSQASDEGTACHAVAAWCLETGYSALQRKGQFIQVSRDGEEPRFVHFTEQLVDLVQGALDVVHGIIKSGAARLILIERRVDFSHIVGSPNQFGTLDVGMLMADGELVILDFKFGYHPVEVAANSQLLIYALALYDELAIAEAITSIRLVIVQPRANGTTEWRCALENLEAFRTTLRVGAEKALRAEREYVQMLGDPDAPSWAQAKWERDYLHPSPNEKDCQFCRAMAGCPAYNTEVQRVVGAAFDVIAETDAQELVKLPGNRTERMRAVAMVEDWCKAVRAEMEAHLLAGGEDPEFGLELGRKGPRKFSDPQAVEDLLRKTFRLKIEDVFDLTLKSPTQLEKLTKPRKVLDEATGQEIVEPAQLKSKRWERVVALVVQGDAKPSVKPKSAIKTPYTVPKPDGSDFSVVD
jgi:hypothetical protein